MIRAASTSPIRGNRTNDANDAWLGSMRVSTGAGGRADGPSLSTTPSPLRGNEAAAIAHNNTISSAVW